MSRADIGRTSRPRTVKATNNQRARFVWPSAKYLFSSEEWLASEPKAIGTLRKTSSISQSVTRCFGQFFPMFPSSQSHPSHSDGSSFDMNVCISRKYTDSQVAVTVCRGEPTRARRGALHCSCGWQELLPRIVVPGPRSLRLEAQGIHSTTGDIYIRPPRSSFSG